MKVELKPTITNQKTNILTRIKRFFVGKLKVLNKDTFEKSSAEQTGKKIIVSRENPNWCDGPETGYRNNTIAQRICYYPEDLKKTESMTEDETILYKRNLYKEGRFYYGETLTKEKHEKFMRSLGLDPEEFYIKDTE